MGGFRNPKESEGMRFILDTNIFICREDHKVIPPNLQRLNKLLNEVGAAVVLHPLSIDDVSNDSDSQRKEISMSKLGTYAQLPSPPEPFADQNFMAMVGPAKKQNDEIDLAILYAVYKNAVDFLVTEDNGIHKKARSLNISDRIFHIDEAIFYLQKSLPDFELSSPAALEKGYMHNLDLADPFFDSLKKDYPPFETWFLEKATENRKCWKYTKGNRLLALLILKSENETIPSIPILPKKKRMKICTLKVEHTGCKMGELFIKLSFQAAIRNDLEEVYLSHFSGENDHLVDLISEFGFKKVAVKPWTDGRSEDVFIKRLRPEVGEEISRKQLYADFYPSFYEGPEVSKFVIPIVPKYSERLFPGSGGQTFLTGFQGDFIVEGNTIKKAYLCQSRIRAISPHDLVFFYRSHDLKKIISFGVIEQVFFDLRDKDEVKRIVGKRTVYGDAEIEKMVQAPTIAILFKWNAHLKNPLGYNQLLQLGVLNGPPRSITNISHDAYKIVKAEGGLDERFAFD